MIVWRPTPKQEQALLYFQDDEFFEILMGGGRGGGKTQTGLVIPLYRKDNPLSRTLVIRRQAEDLKDWVDRAERAYSSSGGKKTGMPGDFFFPSGAIVRTGHLKTENAYSKYVGHEYQLMVIEELNLIPSEDNYLKLLSSCRSTIPELKPKVFATCNPSDVGMSWIKKRFNLHGIPKEPVITVDPKTGLKRVFIPARLVDNPYLAIDPQYNAFLNGLPDGLREAWRDGSWDEPMIQGAYYTLELNQADREGRIGLVPHDPRYLVHRVWDLGISDSMVIGFWQRPNGREIRLINYYQNEGFGLDHYAAKCQELQRLNNYRYGDDFFPFDFNKRELSTGQTIQHTAQSLGFVKSRIVPSVGVQDGIMKVRLMFPRMYVNKLNCEQFISGVRNYRKQWDENKLMYKPEPIEDWSGHANDMLRYTALVEDQMDNESESNERAVYETQFLRQEARKDTGIF